VVYDDVVCRAGPRQDLVPERRWLDLIHAFPDRFMIGSDLLGHFDHLDKVLGRYRHLLNALQDAVAEKVAFENANRIWFTD